MYVMPGCTITAVALLYPLAQICACASIIVRIGPSVDRCLHPEIGVCVTIQGCYTTVSLEK